MIGPAVAGLLIAAYGSGWSFLLQRRLVRSPCSPRWPGCAASDLHRSERPALERGSLGARASATCGSRADLRPF